MESVANQMRFNNELAQSQDTVADAVNVSARSPRRRMSIEGTSYRELRNDTRYQTARELLAKTQMSVVQIAERVGYADARSF